jgi:cytochrome c-type biogenesis protein CcmH/NrfF
MTSFKRCPRCTHNSLRQIHESTVIGTTEWKTTGQKAIVNRIRKGLRCSICNYQDIMVKLIDSKGHVVA